MRHAAFAFLLLWASFLPARAAEETPEIPFTLVDGFILVKGQVEGCSQPVTFLLDSGASTAVLSVAAARRLHLPLGAPEVVKGVEANAVAYRLPGVPVKSGNLLLSHLNLAVDLHNAAALCRRQIDGLIGVEFFSGRIAEIDYAAGCIRLLKEQPATPADCSLPLRQINGVLCTEVSVNGSQPRWTRVDTGCNDALHWVVPHSVPTRKQGVSIGFINEQRDLTYASVRLGTLALEDVETSLHGEPFFPGEAGLLGNGLLSQWTVTIDAVHNSLSLRRP